MWELDYTKNEYKKINLKNNGMMKPAYKKFELNPPSMQWRHLRPRKIKKKTKITVTAAKVMVNFFGVLEVNEP